MGICGAGDTGDAAGVQGLGMSIMSQKSGD